ALEEVDVVPGRAARAVGTDARLDRDRRRRADRLAELASDAALLAVRIAPERVQPAEARRLRRLLLRIEHRRLAREEMLQRHTKPGEELRHQECLYRIHFASLAEGVSPLRLEKGAAPRFRDAVTLLPTVRSRAPPSRPRRRSKRSSPG